MKFEHLVEINDATSGMPLLTRDMLWFGLVCRAEDSMPFLPGLEACEILERGEGFLLRTLKFGGHVEVRDRVVLHPQQWIRFETEQTPQHAGGTLTISIEEPESGALFLRFLYQTTLDEDVVDDDAQYADFVRAAYHQSDLDTVRVIREIIASRDFQ